MNFTTLAKERYSCRKISSRPIESKKLEAIKQAAIAAPTAHNFQPLKVWLIQSPEALEKIKSVTQQKFLHTPLHVSSLVVMQAKDGYAKKIL